MMKKQNKTENEVVERYDFKMEESVADFCSYKGDITKQLSIITLLQLFKQAFRRTM